MTKFANDDFINFLVLQDRLLDTDRGRQAFSLLDAIDSKVAALLTHVTIMLAIAILIFQQIDGQLILFKVLTGLEILGYMIIALGCLVCINIMPPDSKLVELDDLYEATMSAAKFRYYVYRTCLFLTIALTILLAIIFIVNLWMQL